MSLPRRRTRGHFRSVSELTAGFAFVELLIAEMSRRVRRKKVRL
jgi:hypothetical protein